MNHPPPPMKQTDKRIVSKGEYVNVQVERAGLGVAGLACFVVSGVCTLVAVSMLVYLVNSIGHTGHGFLFSDHMTPDDIIISLIETAVWSALAYWIGKYGCSRVNRATHMNNVVPLTRANIAEISAPDSLVRASAEPMQEQQTVLLRAATQAQEQHEEQLVRAVAGGTE